MDKCKPLFGTPIADWHTWFAWFPVKTWDYRIVWLKKVKRRRIQKHHYLTGGEDSWWQYSLL